MAFELQFRPGAIFFAFTTYNGGVYANSAPSDHTPVGTAGVVNFTTGVSLVTTAGDLGAGWFINVPPAFAGASSTSVVTVGGITYTVVLSNINYNPVNNVASVGQVTISGGNFVSTASASDPAAKTTQTIQRFMQRRGDLLLSNGPDMGRQINRLAGAQGSSGGSGAGFAGDVRRNSVPLSQRWSLGAGPADTIAGAGVGAADGSPVASLSGGASTGHLDRLGQSERATGLLPLGFQVGSVSDNGSRVSFGTSLARLAQEAADAKRRKLAGGEDSMAALGLDGVALIQPNSNPFDIWVQGTFTSYDQGAAGSRSDGDFSILHVGMDYVISPSVLIGAAFQHDRMREYSADLGTRIEGQGWMAGPYMTVRASQNVYLQARAAWGKSENDISPFLTYTDTFDTERWLVEGNIQGRWVRGNWSFNPKGSIAYVEEDQQGYRDSLGIVIPGQTVALGQARLGPRIGYMMTTGDGTQFEPYVGLEGIWNFEQSRSNVVASTVASPDAFRGRVDLGMRAITIGGLGFDFNTSYDGIGADNFDAYTGEVRVRLPLQ